MAMQLDQRPNTTPKELKEDVIRAITVSLAVLVLLRRRRRRQREWK